MHQLQITQSHNTLQNFLDVERKFNYFFNSILSSIDEVSIKTFILFVFIQAHLDKVTCKKLLAIKFGTFIVAVSVVFNHL